MSCQTCPPPQPLFPPRGQSLARCFWPLGLLLLGTCLGADWRHFRGSEGRSESTEKGLLEGLAADSVAWRVPLPGPGPSGPIAVAGRMILSCASGPRQDRLQVLAIDAASGQLRWQRQLWATGQVLFNPFGGMAAPTPASDGQRIFALFSSNDLACFDLDGNLLWFRGLSYESPTTRHDVGMASSPLVVGDTLIVQLDNPGPSFVLGIDTATGQTRWRLDRSREASWTSPTLLPAAGADGGPLVLLQSRRGISAHQPRTGQECWRYAGDFSSMSSPCTADGRVFAMGGGGLLCLQPAGKEVKLVWESRRLRCDNVSPVVSRGRVYAVKSPGILVCGDAGNGEVLWQLRLQGPFWATPVVAGGHLVCINHPGLVQLVRLDSPGTLVRSFAIDGEILASPAIADGAIYFRSNRQLWKFSAGRQEPEQEGKSR